MASLDFQLLEAHNVDIENFSYNVSDIVNSIYIGPQGSLLEKIEFFNHSYGTNIGVTKSFTLKPGCYDQIKQAHARWVLRYDLKPRGVKSLFDRMQQYQWRASGFSNTILDIENRMKELKQSGMRWQDNTEQFEVEFDRFKTNIINDLAQVKEMYPNVDVSCKIISVDEGRLSNNRRFQYNDRSSFPGNSLFSDHPKDFIILFYIKLNSIDMMVHVMDDSDTITEYRLPMNDLIVASGTYLLPLISRNWGRTTPLTSHPGNNSYSYFLESIYLSKMGTSFHPYISRSVDTYSWEMKAKALSSNICTGNMSSDIRSSLLNNEILAHITNIITWLTNYYVPQTNPLNHIHRARSFGDDMKFAQWRGDLNTTSTNTFRTQESLPISCRFSSSLYERIFNYARNNINTHHYTVANDLFGSNSVEYKLRLHEYISRIELCDMPCNNCSFKSECEQWKVIQLVFKDELTPEEEGCFGVLYECHEFETNVLNRSETQAYWEIHYIEMAIQQAWRYFLDVDYYRIIQSHRMCIWWSELNSETLNITGHRYRTRMRLLYSKDNRDFDHLYESHYRNTESTMSWTADSIRHYRAPELYTGKGLSTQQSLEPDDHVVEQWLHENDDPTPDIDPNENLTPEQRSIQWAIQHGGANNL